MRLAYPAPIIKYKTVEDLISKMGLSDDDINNISKR